MKINFKLSNNEHYLLDFKPESNIFSIDVIELIDANDEYVEFNVEGYIEQLYAENANGENYLLTGQAAYSVKIYTEELLSNLEKLTNYSVLIKANELQDEESEKLVSELNFKETSDEILKNHEDNLKFLKFEVLNYSLDN